MSLGAVDRLTRCEEQTSTRSRVVPHGVSVLEVEDRHIVGIEAFLDPALLPRFGVMVGR